MAAVPDLADALDAAGLPGALVTFLSIFLSVLSDDFRPTSRRWVCPNHFTNKFFDTILFNLSILKHRLVLCDISQIRTVIGAGGRGFRRPPDVRQLDHKESANSSKRTHNGEVSVAHVIDVDIGGSLTGSAALRDDTETRVRGGRCCGRPEIVYARPERGVR